MGITIKNPKLALRMKMVGIFLITVASFTIGCISLIHLYDQGQTESGSISLGENYHIYRDKTGEATIESILTGKYDQQFQPSHSKYLYFGYTNDSIWLKLNLETLRLDPNEGYWLKSIDKLSQIEAYFVRENGTYYLEKRGVYHLQEQPFPYRATLFHITDPSVEAILIKLSGELPLAFNSILQTEKDFFTNSVEYKLLTGLFYGFMLAFSFYNLFLYFSIKEKMYLYYVFYIVSFLFYQGTTNTLDLEFLNEIVPGWILERSITFMFYLLNICMILFGREFLVTKRFLPKMDRILSVLSVLSVFSLIFAYMLPELYMTDITAYILGYFSIGCLWLAGLLVMLKGNRTARLYLIGWSILLFSIALQGLTLIGLFPFHPAIFEAIPAIAAAAEATILSFALADKINTLKRQREEEQKIMNDRLELLVAERTLNLKNANAKLLKLSTIDSLTRVYNRYQIELCLKSRILEAEQQGASLAVILMDIDYFKEVNDQYGHNTGDRVLRSVARLMKQAVRETDLVGRWGGEEFMIICPNTSLEEAIKIADRLRQTIEQHTFPIVHRKTSSFGISCFQKEDTVEQIVSRADKALYHAKQKGRNRVEVI